MRRIALLLLLATTTLAGCVSGPTRSSDAGHTATSIPAKQATPDYWLDKPATATTSAGNYDKLWKACDRAARSYRFVPDVLNYRQGVMITQPLISRAWAEFWRDDVPNSNDLAHSSLATYRRTIHFEIEKVNDEQYEVGVKVLVERSAAFERRVTTGIQFRDAFAAQPVGAEFRSDDGAAQPQQYWYAVGRDSTLEKEVAETIQDKIAKK